MNKPAVLVVDDERRYRELLEMNLTRRGYRVLLAPDGLSGLNLLELEAPDLVVLDLMLPDLDGYEVCRRIREYSSVPIIMLTAKAEQAQKIRGLQLGADDYITKPFSADEVLARIEAVLRRAQVAREVPASAFDCGDLHVDFDQHRVTLRGHEVDLSPGEYRLLSQLAADAGRVLVQDELLRRVWGPEYAGEPELLHTAVRRLRSKIEDDPAAPRYVLTKRGVGYWLCKP
ncbi:MAG TPA: response regulator transcription factor [Chloroflexota bacterium]|nr:response regulator transcription factor [Chloroflexota bacterium]